MKHFYLLIFTLLFTRAVQAQQNLVPNPSFEDTISLWHPTFWADARLTTDYWNDYNGGPTKANFASLGYGIAPHPPHTGHGMLGLSTGQACWPKPFSGPNMDKEVAISPLITPLIKGYTYYISFYCIAMDSLQYSNMGPIFQPADPMSFANNLGVYFTNSLYQGGVNPGGIGPVPNFNKAPVCAKNVVADTGNWVRISGVYIPDSNYNYIMVGNFCDGPHTTFYPPCKDITGIGGPVQFTYYFIDDVFVSTDSTGFIIDGIKSSKNENEYSFSNVNNQLIFDFKSDATENFGTVYDLYGNIKKTYTFQSQLYDNLNDLTQGIYLVKINHNQTIITKKIVIEHEN